MKKFFSFLLCLLPFVTQAQRLVNTNNQFIGGNTFAKHTSLFWIVPEPTGGFSLIGQTNDSASGDVPPHAGGQALMKTRFNSNGQRIATTVKNYRGSMSSVVRTADNNLLFMGMIDTANEDLLLFKTDTNLNLLWEKSYGSTSQEWSVNAIEVENRNILAFGLSAGRNRDIPYNHTPPGPFPPTDFVLIKTDSLGNKLWVKVLGTSGDEEIQGKVLTDGTYYYLSVTTKAKDYEFTDSTTYPNVNGGSMYFGSFLVKLDTAGNIIYSRSLGHSWVYDAFYDNRDSTILVAGEIGGVTPPYVGNLYGLFDMSLVKAKPSDGSVIWANHYGFDGKTTPWAVNKGPAGSYLMGGIRAGQNGPIFVGGGYEIEVFWISDTGALLDSCLLGGPDDDKLTNLWYDGNQAWVTGYTRSPYFHSGVGANPYPQRNNTFLSRLELWPTGISQLSETVKTLFRISPNPTRGAGFQVDFLSPHYGGRLRLYDAGGALSGSWNIPARTAAWDYPMPQPTPGTYLLQWQQKDGKTDTQKLLVQ